MSIKNTLVALIAFATLSTAASAFAAPSGVVLNSVLARQNTVRVDYGMKLGCGWLLNEDGARVQGKDSDFCQTRDSSHVVEYNAAFFDVTGGEELQMCSQRNLNRCSDWITVRSAGDLNDDQDINVIDLMLLHEYAMGFENGSWPQSDLDLEAADLNGDGAVNVIDILQILELIFN